MFSSEGSLEGVWIWGNGSFIPALIDTTFLIKNFFVRLTRPGKFWIFMDFY